MWLAGCKAHLLYSICILFLKEMLSTSQKWQSCVGLSTIEYWKGCQFSIRIQIRMPHKNQSCRMSFSSAEPNGAQGAWWASRIVNVLCFMASGVAFGREQAMTNPRL